MRSNKIQSIQALRGFAMLLVLARHLLVMEEHYGGGERLLPDVLKAGDGGVDLFFVISGFIMAVISRDQFQRPGALSSMSCAGVAWRMRMRCSSLRRNA